MNPGFRIAIVGGGSAGWMTAAALARALPRDTRLVVVDDPQAPDSGCLAPFDSTLPSLPAFSRSLGLDEDRLMKATDATFKLGSRFSGWTRREASFIHPFSEFGAAIDGVAFHHLWMKLRQAGQVEPFEDFALAAIAARAGRFARPAHDPRSVTSTMAYGLHLDVGAWTAALRVRAGQDGVARIEGVPASVEQSPDGKTVVAVRLEDGAKVEADLFIDCTGTRALVIEALSSDREDWSRWLPCDRVEWSRGGHGAAPLLTEATALRTGWRQTVPLQSGVASVMFSSSRHTPDTPSPGGRSFVSGRRPPWVGNVIALGLSATVLEPLEGTALHQVQSGIAKLLGLFPRRGAGDSLAHEYNRLMQAESERIRDLVIAHYRLNRRRGQPLWDAAAAMDPPAELASKIRLFGSRGRVPLFDEETFEEASWIATFMGHHLQPERYHPLADRFSQAELRARLDRMRAVMRTAVEAMPPVSAFQSSVPS